MEKLATASTGLSRDESTKRLSTSRSSRLTGRKKNSDVVLFLSQFKSPIILILLFAASISLSLGAHTDAGIILTIVIISGMLGYKQERGAANAVESLLALVQIKATVRRGGIEVDIPADEVVAGDVVLLNAGDVIPCDCLLVESKNLYINEASLTGETFPVEKIVGVLPLETPLNKRTNSLFMGSNVSNGSGTAIAVQIGTDTEFGDVSSKLKLRPPETDFERGIRQFGYFLMEVTLLLVISNFAINVYLHKPVLDSFLFAVALAVGLTPQLLPAIINVNLSHGAKCMADEKVIVKRLVSIENFGSMNILCTDKTGTITEGIVQVQSAFDAFGKDSQKVNLYAYLNASMQSGYTNPLDDAIKKYRQFDVSNYRKLDEEPYDFVRKRLSILVEADDTKIIITKGALKNILEVCSFVDIGAGKTDEISPHLTTIQSLYEQFSSDGLRTLGLACKTDISSLTLKKEQETGMVFMGFLVLNDPLKPGIHETVSRLKDLGITLKIITGDNALVAASTSKQAGFLQTRLLTGDEILHMSEAALVQRAPDISIFAEVDPNQKERIIRALRKSGNVVGYIGDGINDAPALHAADIGLSVAEGVDVTKEAADIVLLEKDLAVLERGVKVGRASFANTLKYVYMATSANFGNMFSMAGASLFLPFLPLLPKQILFANMLTDFPEITIASDSVDPELVDRPHRWNIQFIRRFMIVFGLVSTIFDTLTFGVLLLLLHANEAQFRTGWFVESVVTASVVVLVIRTRKPFWKSTPSKWLLTATIAVVLGTLVLPYTPVAALFGLARLPLLFLLMVLIITITYIAVAEIAKFQFYKHTT